MIKRLFILSSFIPGVVFSQESSDALQTLRSILSNTSEISSYVETDSHTLSSLYTRLGSFQADFAVFKNAFDIMLSTLQGSVWGWIGDLRNKFVDDFASWWNYDVSRHVDKASDKLYYFLYDDQDPYELNERTIYEMANEPGDTLDRHVEPFLKSHHFDQSFKDYFEYYSNSHLDILAANNKFLADIALSLSPSNPPSYNVLIPWAGPYWTTIDVEPGEFWRYISSGNILNPSLFFNQYGEGDYADENFSDPNEAIIFMLQQLYDLNTSYAFPMMVMITNQQAIISRLASADTSFTNELAQTVQDDLSDPGKYDTELDSLIQMLDIKESSFHTSFMRNFSSPSSDGMGFQLLESIGFQLPNFSDFEFPTIDIDISGNRRLFEILRKCMIAFWGILSFTFWLFIYKVFLRIILFFARFFAPQVSDGLGKS